MLEHLLMIAIGLVLAMAIAWAVQRMTGASGWIDTIWSAAVGLGGMAAALLSDGDFLRRMIVLAIVLLWSLRLAGHIAARTHGGGEDPRYRKFIEDWGDSAAWKLFVFLQVQALAAFVLVLAVAIAASNVSTFPTAWDGFAVAIAVVALAGEGLSDLQLSRFRRTPEAKSEICETGLWAYSRHPNYFFEWLFWCCFPLFAVTGDLGAWTFASLLAPVMMYWLLVHVSGIPPLEAHMLRSRGEKFRALQGRVNAFFPGPRRTYPPIPQDTCTLHNKGERT